MKIYIGIVVWVIVGSLLWLSADQRQAAREKVEREAEIRRIAADETCRALVAARVLKSCSVNQEPATPRE